MSGNPGGRPKGPSITAAILRNLTEAQADVIAQKWIRDAMRGKQRQQARDSLIERTDGKVTDKIEHSGAVTTSITIGSVKPGAPAIDE